MARTTGKSAQSSAPVQEAVVITPPIIETPVEEVAPKAKKQKKAKVTEEPKVEVEVVAPVVSNDLVEEVAPTTVEAPFNSTLAKVAEFGKRITELTASLASIKLEYKMLEKGISKDIKIAQKHLSKGKRSGIKRAPTGFVKPTLISDELAHFLSLPAGTELGRTAASKEVHNYIKANQLNKGRTIHPDAVLAKILNYTEGVSPVLTYLNLQTYLKHHFIGNKTAVVADAVVA
jgi:chromatin remodeling complex protein RSC6